jgi:hypothetical protein
MADGGVVAGADGVAVWARGVTESVGVRRSEKALAAAGSADAPAGAVDVSVWATSPAAGELPAATAPRDAQLAANEANAAPSDWRSGRAGVALPDASDAQAAVLSPPARCTFAVQIPTRGASVPFGKSRRIWAR